LEEGGALVTIIFLTIIGITARGLVVLGDGA